MSTVTRPIDHWEFISEGRNNNPTPKEMELYDIIESLLPQSGALGGKKCPKCPFKRHNRRIICPWCNDIGPRPRHLKNDCRGCKKDVGNRRATRGKCGCLWCEECLTVRIKFKHTICPKHRVALPELGSLENCPVAPT